MTMSEKEKAEFEKRNRQLKNAMEERVEQSAVARREAVTEIEKKLMQKQFNGRGIVKRTGDIEYNSRDPRDYEQQQYRRVQEGQFSAGTRAPERARDRARDAFQREDRMPSPKPPEWENRNVQNTQMPGRENDQDVRSELNRILGGLTEKNDKQQELRPEQKSTRIGFRDINGDGKLDAFDDVDQSGFADGGSHIDTPYDDVHSYPGFYDENGNGKIEVYDDVDRNGYADGGRYKEEEREEEDFDFRI